MLFNSYLFLFIFLPITFCGYFFIARYLNSSASKIFLVISSLVFYAQWNSIYLFLIGSSIIFNFILGAQLLKSQVTRGNKYRIFLYLVGIVFNLGLLAYFKYFDFFVVNVNALVGSEFAVRNILLPLAISFFTFQQIAFLTERYKGSSEKYGFVDYSLFVVFFPQLIAGPIVQPKDTLRQFSAAGADRINQRNILGGLVLFSIGIFKKVVIADSFVAAVATGFDTSAAAISSIDAWVVALAYTFQLYFDFSGYTDMALGLGLLFNIRLPINFNSPYKALSIQDFWRRWHITLSSFLRDHLYIPMGGNRVGVSRTYLNLFMTFLLGGLWHGAGWTFVVWGAMHGFGLCVHRLWSNLGFELPKMLAWLCTMVFVVTAWVFFRALDFDSAWRIVSAMYNIPLLISELMVAANIEFSVKFLVESESFSMVVKLFFCGLICVFLNNSNEFVFSKLESDRMVFKSWQLAALAAMLATGVLVISLQKYTEFIYFNF